jgi:hypothetical protein
MTKVLTSVLLTLLVLTSPAFAQTAPAPAPTATKAQILSAAQKVVQDIQAGNDAALASDAASFGTTLSGQSVTLDGGRIQLTLGPAIGLTLFEIEKGGLKYPDFGGGGVQAMANIWKATDGNYRLHFGLEVLVGGGTVNGLATTSAVAGLLLGFGGFEHIPLLALGPAVRVPLDGEACSFTMVGSASVVNVLAEW